MDDAVWQEHLDAFYHRHGPCCAGCDWWRSISSQTGSCTFAPIVSGSDRMRSLGMSSSSHPFAPGHPFTEHDHVCGQFKDEFDWATLPLPYRKRIGAPV